MEDGEDRVGRRGLRTDEKLQHYCLEVMGRWVTAVGRGGGADGWCWKRPSVGQRGETQQQRDQRDSRALWSPSQGISPFSEWESWTRAVGWVKRLRWGNMKLWRKMGHQHGGWFTEDKCGRLWREEERECQESKSGRKIHGVEFKLSSHLIRHFLCIEARR